MLLFLGSEGMLNVTENFQRISTLFSSVPVSSCSFENLTYNVTLAILTKQINFTHKSVQVKYFALLLVSSGK